MNYMDFEKHINDGIEAVAKISEITADLEFEIFLVAFETIFHTRCEDEGKDPKVMADVFAADIYTGVDKGF